MNFNISFTNIRSLIPKRDHLPCFIDGINSAIVLPTETWLHGNVLNCEIFPLNHNFSLFPRDGIGRSGGAILIPIKNALASSLICHDDSFELPRVQIHSHAVKTIIGRCYREPDSDQPVLSRPTHPIPNSNYKNLSRSSYLPIW